MRAILLAWQAWAAQCWRLARRAWLAPPPPWALPPASPRPLLTPEQLIRRGNEARGLLGHPLFIEAAQAVEESLSRGRRLVPLADQIMHTRLIIAGQQWELLRGYIEQAVVSGELAGRELLRRQSATERISLAFRRGFRS